MGTQAESGSSSSEPERGGAFSAYAIRNQPQLQERLRTIMSGAVGTLSLDGASIYLLNETRDQLLGQLAVDQRGQELDISGHSVGFTPESNVGALMAGEAESIISTSEGQSGDIDADAVVPVRIENEVVGLLSVRTPDGNALAAHTVQTLSAFAAQAAFAIEAAKAQAQRGVEMRREQILAGVSKAISSAMHPDQVLEAVAKLMARGIQADRAAVYVWDTEASCLRRRAIFNVSQSAVRDCTVIDFPPDDDVARRLHNNDPVYLRKPGGRPLTIALIDAVGEDCALAIPLSSKEHLIAVAVLTCADGRHQFDQEDVDLLMGIAGQAAVSIENSHLYEAQHRAVTELAALYAVSQSLAATVDLNQRLSIVAQSIAAVCGVSRCGVFLIEDDAARGQLMVGASEHEQQEFRDLRLKLTGPEIGMMRAIKEGHPVIIDHRASRRDGFVAARWRVRRMLAVPLINEGRAVGVAAADEPGQEAVFSANAIHVAASIGEQAALFVQNSRLFDKLRQHADDLGVLWEASQALSAEIETEEIQDTLIAHLLRLPITNSVSVMIRRSDGSLLVSSRVGARSFYRNQSELTDPLDRHTFAVLKNREPHVVHDTGEIYGRESGGIETGSPVLSIPLVQQGKAVGAISVIAPEGHELTTGEIRLAASLGSVAAAAINRARLYERERRIAETLQRSFLPDVQERFGEFEIAHSYAAALDEASLGGDFYDVFPLEENRLALVIGDVSGKGLGAAVRTAKVKNLLRAYAFEVNDPGNILTRVNDAFCHFVPSELFVTLFCAILNVTDGVVTYANAGHELPLVWSSASGQFRSLAVTGRALGFFPNCQYMTENVVLNQGDFLLAFTDGITEARRDREFFGMGGVRQAVRAAVKKSAAGIADAVESAVRAYTSGNLRDDIALLVVKRD